MRAAIMTSGPIVASFTARCCIPIVGSWLCAVLLPRVPLRVPLRIPVWYPLECAVSTCRASLACRPLPPPGFLSASVPTGVRGLPYLCQWGVPPCRWCAGHMIRAIIESRTHARKHAPARPLARTHTSAFTFRRSRPHVCTHAHAQTTRTRIASRSS
jgi:hypothetical protein